MTRLAALLCLLAWSGWAQAEQLVEDKKGFYLDIPAIFARHQAEVMTPTPGRRVLELSGPVIVTEISDSLGRYYTAEDQSGLGAAGCVLNVLVEITAAAQLCPDLFSGAEQLVLTAQLRRAAAFFGQNAEPRQGRLDTSNRLRHAVRKAVDAAASQACPDPDAQIDWLRFARLVASGDGRTALDRTFSKPRLPVFEPC